jgi:hypothetical protein
MLTARWLRPRLSPTKRCACRLPRCNRFAGLDGMDGHRARAGRRIWREAQRLRFRAVSGHHARRKPQYTTLATHLEHNDVPWRLQIGRSVDTPSRQEARILVDHAHARQRGGLLRSLAQLPHGLDRHCLSGSRPAWCDRPWAACEAARARVGLLRRATTRICPLPPHPGPPQPCTPSLAVSPRRCALRCPLPVAAAAHTARSRRSSCSGPRRPAAATQTRRLPGQWWRARTVRLLEAGAACHRHARVPPRAAPTVRAAHQLQPPRQSAARLGALLRLPIPLPPT